MSLITRCTSCGTTFKVVTDQLKVSQGWVRCGQCAQVFDAASSLQEVDSIELQRPAVSSAVPKPIEQPTKSLAHASEESVQASIGEVRAAIESVARSFDSPKVSEPKLPDPLDSVSPAEYGPPQTEVPVEPTMDSALNDSKIFEGHSDREVSFMRHARKKLFWQRPLVRAGLVFVALLLGLTLTLQVAVSQRNEIAAAQPALKPWLQKICVPLRGEVKALQRIDAVVIDSSSFTKLNNDLYQLNFVIKSLSAVPLATPALELTLTDAQDQAVIRRVLLPAQLGAIDPVLAPGAEFDGVLGVKVALTSAAPRVAGYRLLAFYP